MVNKVACIFHKGCMDGWMSALAVYKAYEGSGPMQFTPAHYSDTPPAVDGFEKVFIVDFSYKPEVIANWATGDAAVFLLDHHTKAIKEIVESPLLNIQYKCMGELYESTSKSNFTASLAFNEGLEVVKQRSGVGLVIDFFDRFKNSLGIGSIDNRFWDEIRATAGISQSYDLWHHDGVEMHHNTFLSMYFKDWEKRQRDKFNRMIAHPEESHALMYLLAQDWQATALQEKLNFGRGQVIEHGIKCRQLCETAYEVKLPVEDFDDIKIGFIPGEKLDVSVSTLGSIAVREFGWDVMVMIAAVKDNSYILSMRSNENAKNIDVSDICNQIGVGPFGLSGGGHHNAAGCTVKKDDLQEVIQKVELFVKTA